MSLIKNAESLGITYSASALSFYKGDPSDVFSDDDIPHFYSDSETPGQWWQISFSKPVAIKSYIIRTNPTYGARPKSWVVNASFDNKTWQQVDEVSLESDIGGNTTPFLLAKTVNCQHFRIILKKNSNSEDGDNALLFTYFDCFGSLMKTRNGCSCYHQYWKYKIIYHVLLSMAMNTFS